MKGRLIAISSVAVLLLMACGCTAPTYTPAYRYAPQPAMATIFSSRTQKPVLNVNVSVMGIRPANQEMPTSVEVRMRLDNIGDLPVTFDPQSLELMTGSLQSFDGPKFSSPPPQQIAPGQRPMLTALFPLPPGQTVRTMGLDNLRLRWQVQIDNRPIQQTVSVERARPLYYQGE